MNAPGSSTSTLERSDAHNGSETHLHGRWLLLARAVWAVLTVSVLGLNIAALPHYYAILQTVCAAPAPCFGDQLPPIDVQPMHALGFPIGAYATVYIVIAGLSVLIWVLLGALLFWRRSNEPMALFCSFMFVLFGGASIVNLLDEGLAPLSPGWYGLVSCLWFLGQVSFVLFFYLFPTGRFVPRWTRWAALLLVGYYVWSIITGINEPFTPLSALVFFALILTTVVAQIYRFRRVSTPSQRQQTKWVVFAFVLVIVGFVGLYSAGQLIFIPSKEYSSSVVGFLSDLVARTVINTMFLLIPFSMAIAMLRYRLWDIDTIINKALVYGLLTALLASIYVGLIIGLESLIALFSKQGTQPLVIVISTLAIYALFWPLRRRIQASIDRRFYRRKYDASKVVATFSDTLRQEVDLDQLREHLLAVVQETMQPSHVSLWLHPPAHDGTQRAPWRAGPPVSSEER